MDYSRHGKITVYIDASVERVWRAMTGNQDPSQIEAMSAEEYEKDPGPGYMFTKLLEMKQNECFSFECKSSFLRAVWRCELEGKSVSETKVKLSQDVYYNERKYYLLSLISASPRKEVSNYAENIIQQIHDERDKGKKKKALQQNQRPTVLQQLTGRFRR